MPSWIRSALDWSWTYPWLWFALRTYQALSNSMSTTSLGEIAERMTIWVNIGTDALIAFALSFAAWKISEFLERKF
jgi:hypothetical protein